MSTPEHPAADAIEDGPVDAPVEPSDDDAASQTARRLLADLPTDVGDLVTDWVAAALDAYPRPVYPLAREWDVSVQGLVRLVPYVPRFATAPLGLLDRFGAVTVGPQRVGLDGKDVEWDRVLEIRTEPAWTALSAEALEADLARFVTFIPPLPGRAWVLRKIGELVLSLYLSALPPEDAPVDDEGGDPLFSRVVSSVRYRRRFGQGEADVSATSALLQLALPGTVDTIVRTAAQHGVTVTHVPATETSIGSVVERAAVWRRTAIDLRLRVLDRLSGDRPR